MQMLHRREHGRLLVQGRAVVCKTKTCAGCEDMSKKRLSLTRMLRNVGEKRHDHVAMHGALCLLVLHASCLSCGPLASSFLL